MRSDCLVQFVGVWVHHYHAGFKQVLGMLLWCLHLIHICFVQFVSSANYEPWFSCFYFGEISLFYIVLERWGGGRLLQLEWLNLVH